MTNSYCGLSTFKSAGVVNITGTGNDTRLREYLEVASRHCDDYCLRRFYAQIATRYFSGNGKIRMKLPADLVAVTSLKEDQGGDAVYETTWAVTDYELGPWEGQFPANPATATVDMAAPYTEIAVNDRSTGTMSDFTVGQKRFELIGKWGYCESLAVSASVTAEVLDASETGVDVTAGTDFEVGQTIIVESEAMYVTGIATNTLTVQRGVNGTTAATHTTAAAISVVQYPSWLRQAVEIEAARLWKLKDSGFASSVGTVDGSFQTFSGNMHPTARRLLDPYRLVGV